VKTQKFVTPCIEEVEMNVALVIILTLVVGTLCGLGAARA
jgi:hypothetical protein